MLLAGLLLLYTASATGVFRTDDEHILAARSQSLALWGNLGQTQVYGNHRVQELRAQGDAAIEIEPGQVVLGAIAYRVARFLGAGGAQAFLLVNAYITSLTALFVFLTSQRLGIGPRVSLLAALLYGIATMAWPYATTGYRDPLAALGWSVALWGWAIVLTDWPRGWRTGALVMGLGLLAAVLAKNTSFALVASFALTLVIWTATAARSRRVEARRAILALGITAAVVVAVLWILPPAGPLARYSLPYFAFLAHHALSGGSRGLLASVLGPFLSPAESIFLFSPAVLLSVAGLLLWRGRQAWFALPAALSALLLAVLQALFYRELWAGVYGWGLRFMLPALPALAILAAPFLERALSRRNRAAWILIVALFVLAIVIQASAVLVPWLRPYQDWKALGLDPFRTDAVWSLRFLAIPPQVGHLADPSIWETLGARLARAGSGWAGALQVMALVASVVALTLAGHGASRETHRLRIPAVVLCTLALLAPPVLLCAASEDPAWGGSHPEYVEASDWLQAQIGAGDLVLVESYGSPLWAHLLNRWRSSVGWTSLPYDVPGDQAASLDAWIVDAITAAGPEQRVWLITSSEAPGFSASVPQAYLADVRGPGRRWVFDGRGRTEIIAYP